MPKTKTQSKNVLEHSHSDIYTKSNRRNGFPYPKQFCCFPQSVQTFRSQKAEKPTFTEDIKCSLRLFPHLIHILDLTKNFIKRGASLIKIPKDRFSDESMRKVWIKVHRSDTLSLQLPLGSQEFCEPECWPFVPTISVCEIKQAKIENGVLLMDELKYEKTKKMLKNTCVDTKEIRFAITHPDVREVHEALTELLETPILELLKRIKEDLDAADVPHQLGMLSTELNILLNTVKHTGSKDTFKTAVPTREVCCKIPEGLKNYLSKKRGVLGFGIWKTEEFRVFINQKVKEKHICEYLLRNFARFFETKRLDVMICEPCYHPYFQQGDKIFRTISSHAEAPIHVRDSMAGEEKKYGTLGGFVTDEISNTYALTCAHVCSETERSVFAAQNDSERVKIGKCVFSSDLQAQTIPILADIALVKIDNEVKDRCNPSILNELFHQSKVKIFSDNLEDLVERVYVYKIGAETKLTKGCVLSPEVYFTGRHETFLVSGFEDVPFAERGDSGSLVFISENSSALDTIIVIGMLFGSYTLNDKTTEKKDNDEEVKKDKKESNENSACFRMDTALELLRQNGWNIRFLNQI